MKTFLIIFLLSLSSYASEPTSFIVEKKGDLISVNCSFKDDLCITVSRIIPKSKGEFLFDPKTFHDDKDYSSVWVVFKEENIASVITPHKRIKGTNLDADVVTRIHIFREYLNSIIE
jgi:hypothetical protein